MKLKKTSDIEATSFHCLIYGQSGVGKTTLASTLDDCVIISCESGLLSLKQFNLDYIEVSSLQELNDALIFTLESKFKTIFIDSLTEISQMFLDYARLKYKDDSQTLKMYNYYNDLIVKFIKSTRDMKKNVVYTALDKVEKSETGRRYHTPDLIGSIATKVPQYFDFVFAYRIFENEDGEKHRVLITDNHDDYIAKSRLKLDPYERPHLGNIISKAFNLNKN